MKNVLLYFGSFNPVHNGHIALAEYAVERGLCDEAILVVSPQNPLKPAWVQAPEMDRFEMAEAACAASRYPDRIKPSVVEFLLEKPSYTIHTLRYLQENFGDGMRFSILMGSDLTARLPEWKCADEILRDYPIYVYPRRGYDFERRSDRMTFLEDAPMFDCSSTAVREAAERGEDLSRMVCPEVARLLRERGLYSAARRVVALTAEIDRTPEGEGLVPLLLERGMCRYRNNEWGEALNDFNRILRIDPSHREAGQLVEMVQEILAYRYKDIYNP